MKLKKQALSVITVVVSGDIQSEAQHKIRTLGAIGFINNPIDKSELTPLLTEYRLCRSHAQRLLPTQGNRMSV